MPRVYYPGQPRPNETYTTEDPFQPFTPTSVETTGNVPRIIGDAYPVKEGWGGGSLVTGTIESSIGEEEEEEEITVFQNTRPDYLIASVGELIQTRDGVQFNQTSKSAEHVRRFLVRFKDRYQPNTVTGFRELSNGGLGYEAGAAFACSAPGIPDYFTPYVPRQGVEYNLHCLVVRKSAVQLAGEERHTYIVTVDYSSEMPPGGPDYKFAEHQGLKPWLEPAEFEMEDETTNKPLTTDLDGKAFLNSARQPFSPPPTFERACAVLVMTRNEKAFKWKTITDMAYSVNKEDFMGAKPGCVLLMPPRARREWRGNVPFWRVTWRFKFGRLKLTEEPEPPENPFPPEFGLEPEVKEPELETWQPEILDQGLCEKQRWFEAPFAHRPKPIIGPGGNPVTQPVLLDGEGGQAMPEGPEHKIKPVFLKFRVYPTRDFQKIFSESLLNFEAGAEEAPQPPPQQP